MHMICQSQLMKEVIQAVDAVRNDKEKEVAYMTYVAKLEESRREGLAEGMAKSLCNLVYKGILPLKDALDEAGLSESEFMDWMHQFHPDYHPN